jgi:hypothetical protein
LAPQPFAIRLAFSSSDAMPPIAERLDNWAAQYRLRRLRGQANSFEGNFRCNRFSAEPGAPGTRTDPDIFDAQLIEDALSLVPLYHHLLLRFHYIRKWSPGKCLTEAAEQSRAPRGEFGGYDASLHMAQTLLEAALRVPSVVRKVRVRQIVRDALDGEV